MILRETPNTVNTNSEVRNFRLSTVIQNNWKVGSVSSLDIKNTTNIELLLSLLWDYGFSGRKQVTRARGR